MYQALVRRFELFNNLPQPECYYCRKNVWSYNKFPVAVGGGRGGTLKGGLGGDVLPSYLNNKKILLPTLLK